MPVFAVKSEGVSLAMSFICGLSTMATLIEPPFVLVSDAGVPPLVDPDLLPPPPQPAATTPTTASTAAADLRPIVPLISLPSCVVGGQRDPSAMHGLIPLVYVGCQGPFAVILKSSNACRMVCPVFMMRACGSTASDQSQSGSPGRDRTPRGSSSRLRPRAACGAHRPH